MENTLYDYSPIINRKPIKWPDGARVALWVIPNIEHYLVDIPSTAMYPSNLVPDVLNYGWRDYAPRVGVWRLMEAMDKYKVRGTVALNSDVCKHYPIIMEEAMKRKWEFMGHATTNSKLLTGLSEDDERKVIRETVETIKKTTGVAPRGWLGPALAETFQTPEILAEHGIEYLCDFCNDDQPYPMKVKKGRMINVPYALELNDIPFFVGKGNSGEDFMQAIKDQFDVLYDEGKTNGRVMAIALHPFIIGAPFRMKHFVKALKYVTEKKKVWVTTGGEIADWYYKHYYKD
jgi:allantoinase